MVWRPALIPKVVEFARATLWVVFNRTWELVHEEQVHALAQRLAYFVRERCARLAARPRVAGEVEKEMLAQLELATRTDDQGRLRGGNFESSRRGGNGME